MENSNIYSAWQTEVMNKIKQKLHSIRNSLKLTLVGKKDGKLKEAVNKVRNLIREEKKISAQTKALEGEEQNRHSISLMQIKSRERKQKEQQLKEEKKLLQEEKKQRSPLRRVYTKGEYIKALARVKQRGYIDEKLRLLKNQRKVKGTVSCVLDKRQDVKRESINDLELSARAARTIWPFDIRGRRFPMRFNLIQEFSLVRSVLVDKQVQNFYRFLVNKFIQSGYSLKDLLHDRRLYTTAININPGGSVEELRLSSKPLLCLSPELVAYFDEVCRQTVLFPATAALEVVAPAVSNHGADLDEEMMSEKLAMPDSFGVEELHLVNGWLKNLESGQLEEICRRIKATFSKSNILQKRSKGKPQKRRLNRHFSAKDGRHISDCAVVKPLKPAKCLETMTSLRASSLHRPVSPFSPKLLFTGEKRKMFYFGQAQRQTGRRKVHQTSARSRLVENSQTSGFIVQSESMVPGQEILVDSSTQQQSQMVALHVSKRSSFLSTSKPQLDSDSQSVNWDSSTNLSEFSPSSDRSESDFEELSSTGWTASSSSSSSVQLTKSAPLLKRSNLQVSDLGRGRSTSL